ALLEAVAPGRDVEALAADQHVVVPVGVELEEVEVAADAEPLPQIARGAARPKVADVVHAGAEAVPLEGEGVAPAAREVVLLEHHHLLPGLRQGDRGGKPAHARTDDD